jgi:hypothetical protein
MQLFALDRCLRQIESAVKWLEAIPPSDHETLAAFLERQGRPELVMALTGLSLETAIDFAMRYGYVSQLEDIVDDVGARGLRFIDMGRGIARGIFGPASNFGENSFVVCVGAYLLAHGRTERVRRLASECLRLGEEGKKDAFALASIMLSIDPNDARRILRSAVEGVPDDDWLVAAFAKTFIGPASSP